MKTRLVMLVKNSGVCESEPGSRIDVGRSYDAIRAEMEERFKDDTDENFRSGKLGFMAKSRKDHLDQIAFDEYDRQFGYAVAGQIMSEICNLEEGDRLTIDLQAWTEDEWNDCVKQCQEIGLE